MADSWYTLGKQNLLDGNVDFNDDNLKTVLLDEADYTINLTTDNDLADIPTAARVATSSNMTTTVTNGVFDAQDITLSSVTGDQSESLTIYKDSGVEGTSFLFINIDAATGLPVTPNGGDITITWDSGDNKIFAF